MKWIQCLVAFHWRDKPVSAARKCFDVAGSLGGVAKCLAKAGNRVVDTVVEIDEGVGGPENAAEVFAADELAGVLEKINKRTEGLLANPDRDAIAAQLGIAGIDLEDAEAPDLGGIFLDCQRRSPRPRCSWAESSMHVRRRDNEIDGR